MVKDWTVNELRKSDKSKGIIILENPENKKYLDNLLTKRFWPVILNKMKCTGYEYEPIRKFKIETELSHELTRSLTLL